MQGYIPSVYSHKYAGRPTFVVRRNVVHCKLGKKNPLQFVATL